MRYFTTTQVLPEDVLSRARDFMSANSSLTVREEDPASVTFAGAIGVARFSVDRHGGQTNVHLETDRVAGLDVTDVARRFLYSLREANRG